MYLSFLRRYFYICLFFYPIVSLRIFSLCMKELDCRIWRPKLKAVKFTLLDVLCFRYQEATLQPNQADPLEN